MFDIGWTEFFAIAVLALIVVGPKDLPTALRAVTRLVRKARGMAREFQSGIDEMVREAELEDVRTEINKARSFDLSDTVKREVDPTGTLTSEFDPREFARDLKERVEGGPPSRPETEDGSEKPLAESPVREPKSAAVETKADTSADKTGT